LPGYLRASGALYGSRVDRVGAKLRNCLGVPLRQPLPWRPNMGGGNENTLGPGPEGAVAVTSLTDDETYAAFPGILSSSRACRLSAYQMLRVLIAFTTASQAARNVAGSLRWRL